MKELAVLFSAALLCICSDRAWAWQTTLGHDGSAALAMALDPGGDLVAVGFTSFDAFSVVKLSPDTGDVLWQRDIIEDRSGADDVVVDSVGDVIASGRLDADHWVIKYSGADGTELWRRFVQGHGISFTGRGAIAIDAQDNVVASDGRTGGDPDVIVKLAGSDGSELWRVSVPGSVRALTFDGNGDVIAGSMSGELHKLSGVDGTTLWTWQAGSFVSAVGVDANGDVVGSGFKVSGPDGTLIWGNCCVQAIDARIAIDPAGDVFVADAHEFEVTLRKLSGADGTQLWERTFLNGAGDSPGGNLAGIALDSAGDPVTVGQISNLPDTGRDWLVASVRGSDGAVHWRRDLDGPRSDTYIRPELAEAVVVDAAGRVFVAGSFNRSGRNGFTGFFTVMRLTGTLPSQAFTLRDSGPDRRIVSLRVRDRGVTAPPGGGAGDPTLHGAALTLANPTTDETGTIALPASNWSGLGETPGVLGYRYRDPAQEGGPCQKVDVRNGKLLKLRCKGAGIPFSLDEPAGQGSLAVTLTMGTDALPHCILFGGTVKRDTSTTGPTGKGLFRARKAPEPVVCPEVGSPSAAFLDAGLGLLD